MNTLYSKLFTHRNAAILACLLTCFVIVDLFVLPPLPKTEILDNGTIDVSYGEHEPHNSYFFITKENDRFEVPEYLYNTILIGDTFIVAKTPVFNRNSNMQWCKENRCYKMNLSSFNSSSTSYWLLGAIFMVSLLFSLNIISFQKSRFKTYNFIMVFIAIGNFIIYLVF